MVEIIDYNGEGEWSREGILDRYARYCRLLAANPLDLSPIEHTDGKRKWIHPVMDRIIEGIGNGDVACKLIGIEFIEQDRGFAFGMVLKYQTARALRRTELTEEDKERIRRRVADMLARGYLPREFREYAKLLRKIGLDSHRSEIEALADSPNAHVVRYASYLLSE